MKKYEKPIIDDEIIEIEDICNASNGGATENGINVDFPFVEE